MPQPAKYRGKAIHRRRNRTATDPRPDSVVPLRVWEHRGVREEVAGFSKVAAEYERGRPGYPPETVRWVVAETGLGPGETIVDLAAGTGKLTRHFVACGARVIAVEPLAEMHARLSEVSPAVEVIEGTADDMKLPDGTARVVTIAQAFHWFAHEQALQEIARVLQPIGYLALVWNRRDLSQPLQADLTRVMASHRHAPPSHESGEWARTMERTELFDKVDEHRVEFEQHLEVPGLLDRVASTSFIANLPDEERADVLTKVRALVADPESSVSLRYECQTYLYRRR